MSDRDQRVRERAYHLWERAGRPEHGGEDFWHRAHAEIEAEVSTPPPAQPEPAVQPEPVQPEPVQPPARIHAPAESLRMAQPATAATPSAKPKSAEATAEKPKAEKPKPIASAVKPAKSAGKTKKKT